MTHILLQGLTGKPAFVSDPTVDESTNSIILAHCIGTRKMDGPDGPTSPYKLRTVHERQEGVTSQSQMRKGQSDPGDPDWSGPDPVLHGRNHRYAGRRRSGSRLPDQDQCPVDGDVTTLWKNWSNGLHRQTVYGNVVKELGQFCRYTGIKMVDEAAKV